MATAISISESLRLVETCTVLCTRRKTRQPLLMLGEVSIGEPSSSFGRASDLFSDDLFGELMVQGELEIHSIESQISAFQGLRTPQLNAFRTLIFLAPSLQCGSANAVFSAHILGTLAPFKFFQYAHNLLWAESALSYGSHR
jgi:hypothetical protein